MNARYLRMSPARWLALLSFAFVLVSCKEERGIDTNITPTANAGEDQQVDYDGSTVSVRLDGRGSADPDGEIVEYIWLSGNRGANVPDGGMEGPDPDNEARPTVELDEGVWTFALWVRDDDGSTSDPDYVEITVGQPAGDVGPDGGAAGTCNPDECEAPPVGMACCTTADTGEDTGDFRGRLPDHCGVDLGAVLPDLAGVCLQYEQAGEASSECPEIMGAGGLEPGCCTDEGFCASINTSVNLGCHYPSATGAGDECTP